MNSFNILIIDIFSDIKLIAKYLSVIENQDAKLYIIGEME